MLVSIIIPSHRQPQFLGRAIESCLAQDHTDLEVIVVDDHSRDSSLGVAASFAAADQRVRIVAAPGNGGLGWARNVGVAHATGDFLCFLDSDDYLLERSISARLEAFPSAIAEHGNDVVGVYGDWQHVAEAIDDPVVRRSRSDMPLVSRNTYTGENVFICSAPLVRRDAVLAAGGFPEGLRMLEDFALWAKIIASGGVFAPVHHVVSTYRQRPNSMLRGDGVVIMADHVDVINDWVVAAGTSLADGGALNAWLTGGDPRPFGRMSWSVPSVLGSAGGGTGAASLHVLDGVAEVIRERSVDDFMTASTRDGLDNPPPMWNMLPPDPDDADIVVLVKSVPDCLAAVSFLESATPEKGSAAVAVVDPKQFEDTWPLALAGIVPLELAAAESSSANLVTMNDVHDNADSVREAIATGVSLLWPEQIEPSASAVYVPRSIADHPALDAWLSTALHALAEADLDPTIIADPRARHSLGGYRSSIFSIDDVRAASMLVMPRCDEIDFLSSLTNVIVFDPFAGAPNDAHDKNRLQRAIRAVRTA